MGYITVVTPRDPEPVTVTEESGRLFEVIVPETEYVLAVVTKL